MLRLSLLRHAKSGWDDPDLSDHQRPLTKRGTRAATRMGRYFVENNLTPDLILCSDAVRTKITLTLILSIMDQPAPPATITNKLYLANADAIRRVIGPEADSHRHIMVIGHNPGLQALALSLPVTANQPDALSRLTTKYPTAALAHLTFDLDDWSDIGHATGNLELFVTPKELSD